MRLNRTDKRHPRSLSEAFPCERAYAGFGPYRRDGMLSRVLMWLEGLAKRAIRG